MPFDNSDEIERLKRELEEITAELAKKYRNRIELKYRYWKSDNDTLAGKYSKEFIDRLAPKEKRYFKANKQNNNKYAMSCRKLLSSLICTPINSGFDFWV